MDMYCKVEQKHVGGEMYSPEYVECLQRAYTSLKDKLYRLTIESGSFPVPTVVVRKAQSLHADKPYRKAALQNTMIEYEGEKMSLWDVATLHGLDLDVVRQRHNKGWSIEDAVSVPKHGQKPRYVGSLGR